MSESHDIKMLIISGVILDGALNDLFARKSANRRSLHGAGDLSIALRSLEMTRGFTGEPRLMLEGNPVSFRQSRAEGWSIKGLR